MKGLLGTLLGILPPKMSIQLRYYHHFHKFVNFRNPKTFSEKIQWLKIHNRKPEYTTMVDKYAVKDYVAQIIGEEYIIPTIGVWDRPEDVDFDSLPNQFVLKTTHAGGSGGVVICKNKLSFDKIGALKKLSKSYKTDSYSVSKEWPYKNVSRRIIAEQYIEDSHIKELRDYKIFCFNGKPKLCQVIAGRESVMTVDFFDKDWNHQPFHEPKNTQFSSFSIIRPKNLDLMWTLSEQLAENIPFVRIDFYEVNDNVFFGEITFYPTSGCGGFYPTEWDAKFGDWIKLPKM